MLFQIDRISYNNCGGSSRISTRQIQNLKITTTKIPDSQKTQVKTWRDPNVLQGSTNNSGAKSAMERHVWCFGSRMAKKSTKCTQHIYVRYKKEFWHKEKGCLERRGSGLLYSSPRPPLHVLPWVVKRFNCKLPKKESKTHFHYWTRSNFWKKTPNPE